MTGKRSAQLVLEGEWSLERADDLQKALAATLGGLLAAEPRPEMVEVLMAEVSEIDACGCQLLAVLLENIRRQGITPFTCDATEAVLARIAQLGFAAYFQGEPGGVAQ